jgi:hypothetical protein
MKSNKHEKICETSKMRFCPWISKTILVVKNPPEKKSGGGQYGHPIVGGNLTSQSSSHSLYVLETRNTSVQSVEAWTPSDVERSNNIAELHICQWIKFHSKRCR